jgi:hypothetical protein
MEGIINLHHDLMFFIVFIFFFVSFVMSRTIKLFGFTELSDNNLNDNYLKIRLLETFNSRKVVHGTAIEII